MARRRDGRRACGLSFAPIKFLHPLRVKRLRASQHRACWLAWAVLALVAVIDNLEPGLTSSGRWR